MLAEAEQTRQSILHCQEGIGFIYHFRENSLCKTFSCEGSIEWTRRMDLSREYMGVHLIQLSLTCRGYSF